MSSKILKSLIEKNSLIDFEKEFKEAVSNEIQNIIEEMRKDIKAQFTLKEAADIVGSAKDDEDGKKDKSEKESPKADDDSKGPSDEPDADDTEADKKEKMTEVSK